MASTSLAHARPRSGVTLRAATPSDEALLRQVYADSRADELAPVPWSDEQKSAFLRMQFDAQDSDYHRNFPDADFLVIVEDGAAIGRMYVHRRATEICLVDIALLSDRRGRGIGTALVTALLDEARASARRVCLHVEPFNPALRLYLRLGFKPVEQQGVYLAMEWAAPTGGVSTR